MFLNLLKLVVFLLNINLSILNDDSNHVRTAPRKSSQFKNVVLIVADDLGWSDIGYADVDNNLKPLTPNIDRLASKGILLNNFYTYALCTPSRASLMSGVFVERLGLQHSVIELPNPVGLTESFKLMPQYFKNFSYKTHLVGKWHLGSCNIKYTPCNRGFDSFYGFFGALNDYMSHRIAYNVDGFHFTGLDFWNQTADYLEPIINKNNSYSQFSFTQRAQEILETHNKSEPFFLYYSAQTPHTDPRSNVVSS